MNEMYNMSIVAHNWGVISLFFVILVNFLLLAGIDSLPKYKRVLSLYNPIAFVAIGFILFTGVVMMAAKHLDFTISNIAMIATASIYIYLEVVRLKKLRFLNHKDIDAIVAYKVYAKKLLGIEALLALFISLWMWI